MELLPQNTQNLRIVVQKCWSCGALRAFRTGVVVSDRLFLLLSDVTWAKLIFSWPTQSIYKWLKNETDISEDGIPQKEWLCQHQNGRRFCDLRACGIKARRNLPLRTWIRLWSLEIFSPSFFVQGQGRTQLSPSCSVLVLKSEKWKGSSRLVWIACRKPALKLCSKVNHLVMKPAKLKFVFRNMHNYCNVNEINQSVFSENHSKSRIS